jgi:hypothetical protein
MAEWGLGLASGSVDGSLATSEGSSELNQNLGTEKAKHAARKLAALATDRAQQMRTHFFSLGYWRLARQNVLNRVLETPEVKRLMPDIARQTRPECADAETAAELTQQLEIKGWLACRSFRRKRHKSITSASRCGPRPWLPTRTAAAR